MPRYIDAEPYKDMYIGKVFGVTIKAAKNLSFGDFHGEDFVKVANINEIPTADVREVKHGRWIYKYNGTDHDDVAYCSLCNFYVEDRINNVGLCYRYCPNCCARMDADEKMTVKELEL